MSQKELNRQYNEACDSRRAAIEELQNLEGHDHSCNSPRIPKLQAEITSLNENIAELESQLAPDEDDTDEEDAHEGEVLCPVCGGFGGESYGSDSGTCDTCGGTCYVDENWGEDDDDDEELTRDVPGIFEMWEDDVAELLVKPEDLGNLGACEPEQLEEMSVGMVALANIILGLYHQWTAGTTDLVWSKDVEVDGEIDDETLERNEKEIATYLTFDCRTWLKPTISLPAEQEGGEQND